MRFLILRVLTHSELGMFHEYRRQGKEGSKQRAINFDGEVVDRVFPSALDTDRIELDLRLITDDGVAEVRQSLKRQDKNWRLEGHCPRDVIYDFVEPGCLFAMEIDAGGRPAAGSWAVFPRDSEVTRAVLGDGAAGGLASAGMIALHENEGAHIGRLLASAEPRLFSFWAGEEVMSEHAEIGRGNVRLPPNPKRLIRALGSVGHTLASAVADIIDNSISADATRIDITFRPPDEGHGRWMTIADNGEGMDWPQLSEAMRVGSDSEYDDNGLGKFGYGLKGASWSQTDIFTVATRKAGGEALHLTWDADKITDWEANSDPLEPWEQEITAIRDHGTVVFWKDMRPPLTAPEAKGISPFSAEEATLERHLALVFHRFLEGKALGRKKIVIQINGRAIEPNNPVGHPLAVPYDAKPLRAHLPNGEDAPVQVQPFLLPTEDELTNYHQPLGGSEAVRRAADLIGLHGRRNDTQGLFIYRNDRLIKWGGWHDIWTTNEEKTKLARVVVNFDPRLDDAFQINISKQIVHLPATLKAEIRKLAEVVRKESFARFGRGPKTLPPLAPPAPPSGNPTVPGAPGAPAGPTRDPDDTAGAPGPGVSAPPPPPPPTPPPRVTLRTVTTSKFVWKVGLDLTGRSLQVSDLDPSLSALAKRLAKDPEAASMLADFLERLDGLDVQAGLIEAQAD